MYKVFFNDRIVFLTHDFLKNFQENQGLFYKFREKKELEELLLVYLALNKISQLFICHPDVDELFREFRSCFIYVEASGGLVRNNSGEVLFIKRLNKWDLPKGKDEKNESAEETALREVEEECGISGLEIVSELKPTYHTYYEKSLPYLKKTRWFEMIYSGDQVPKPQTEEFITKIIWARDTDMSFIVKNTYPSIIELLVEASVITLPLRGNASS
jgi:8-oxo-dGTP pyrophosphatase MutT (NUDIX family)